MPRAAIRQLIYLLLSVSSLASAQELKIPDTPEVLNIAPPPSDRFPATWYPKVGDGTDVLPAPVVGKLYVATVETVNPYQGLAGEPLLQITHGFHARDRFGRERTEAINGGMTINGQNIPTKSITVSDPVSHCQFNWTQLTVDVTSPADKHLAFVTCNPQTLRYKDIDSSAVVFNTLADGMTTHGDTITKTEHLPPLRPKTLLPTRRLPHRAATQPLSSPYCPRSPRACLEHAPPAVIQAISMSHSAIQLTRSAFRQGIERFVRSPSASPRRVVARFL